jgi:hypothetical protein
VTTDPRELWRKAEADAKRTALEDRFAFQLKQLGLPKPEREHRFAAPERQWRFDFAWLAFKLAVELDGGTAGPVRGRHVRPQGFQNDLEKHNAAQERGWRVYRFTSSMVRSGHAVNMIRIVLERAAAGLAPDFKTYCERGHRIVPSTGECTTLHEHNPDPDGVRVFKNISAPCEEHDR